MKLVELPKDFARIYKLHDLVDANSLVSIKIQKGMYGLPQAGILSVGTLDDRYVRNVPLPRAPRIQSASHVTCYGAVTRDTVTEPGTNTDTCYSQVACVPTSEVAPCPLSP
jgi:hypothetical protein